MIIHERYWATNVEVWNNYVVYLREEVQGFTLCLVKLVHKRKTLFKATFLQSTYILYRFFSSLMEEYMAIAKKSKYGMHSAHENIYHSKNMIREKNISH